MKLLCKCAVCGTVQFECGVCVWCGCVGFLRRPAAATKRRKVDKRPGQPNAIHFDALDPGAPGFVQVVRRDAEIPRQAIPPNPYRWEPWSADDEFGRAGEGVQTDGGPDQPDADGVEQPPQSKTVTSANCEEVGEGLALPPPVARPPCFALDESVEKRARERADPRCAGWWDQREFGPPKKEKK